MEIDSTAHWVDLHLHSDKSDGTCTIQELINHASAHRLNTIAITDHDTVDGLEEGIRTGKAKGIGIIPGIEISSKYAEGTLHILGYGIDYKAPQFLRELKRFQAIRKERNIKIIAKLKSLGIEICMSEIIKENREVNSLGRPHIAAVLVEKGVVKSMDTAFKEFLGKQGKAFISKDVFTSEETIRLIHDAGGLAFLAHPSTLNLSGKSFTDYIQKLVGQGLDGLEVYSSAHNKAQIQIYQRTAKKFNLSVSAGSDYHGTNKKDVQIGFSNSGSMVSANMISQQLLKMVAN